MYTRKHVLAHSAARASLWCGELVPASAYVLYTLNGTSNDLCVRATHTHADLTARASLWCGELVAAREYDFCTELHMN